MLQVNKRRVITLLTAILLVFSFLLTPIKSPEKAQALAPASISDPYEDLKASEGFDESKYAFVTDITVVDFCEYWREGATTPHYVVYVYNPTESELKDSIHNKVHIRLGGKAKGTDELAWQDNWSTYGLDYLASSADGKYVKYQLVDNKLVYDFFKDYDVSQRYYDISEVKLVQVGKVLPDTIRVGFQYLYTVNPNGGLKVEKETYDVIRIDELVPMVYRNIKGDVCNYPNGQISSVAFNISNDVLEKYGAVSAINFEYYKYRTSPIVVSDSRNGFNMHERRDEWLGKQITGLDDQSNPLGLVWGNMRTLHGEVDEWDYGYNNYELLLNGNTVYRGDLFVKEYRKLCYSFGAGSQSVYEYDVTSEDLTNWIYSYADTYLAGKEYESLPVKDGLLPVELFEDYNNTEKYGYMQRTVTSDTLKYTEKYAPNWWENYWGYDTSYSAEYDTIQVIDSADLDKGDVVVGDKYKVNVGYVDDLLTLQTSASLSNATTMIFHFDVTDYYCSKAKVFGTFGGVGGSWGHCYVAQEDVYFNFAFIDFTFTKEDVATTLAVSSPVIDVIPPIQHPVDGDGSFWYWFKLILGIALIIFLVIVFWNPLLWVLKLVFNIIAFPFKAIGKAISKSKSKHKKGKFSSKEIKFVVRRLDDGDDK